MKRFFLLLGAVVALLALATTAAFAGDSKGKSGASHGKAAQAHQKKSGGPQAGTSGGPTKAKISTHGNSTHGKKGGGKVKAGGNAGHVPPGCNGTIHLSAGATAENGTQPKYTMGEEVWAHGRGFDESESFTHFTVYKVNSGHAVIKDDRSGWDADASGAFDLEVISTTLTPGHEYQVVVYWNETLPNGKVKECRKSKNFFTTGEEEQGVGGTTTEETGGTTTEETGGSVGSGGSGGVAGTTASGNVQQTGGVLGAVASGATRNLPFTGLPIWIPLLAGAGLLAAGLMLRHARG
jgi:hypothetical protein